MREREIQYQGGDVTALLNGAGDPLVPKDELQAFEKEMLAAGVDDKVANFPGGKHAFTHPAARERGKKYGLPRIKRRDRQAILERGGRFLESGTQIKAPCKP